MKDFRAHPSPDHLPRGVHRERASYGGYVSYKAVTDSGMLAAHLIVLEALDGVEGQPARIAGLWEAIEEAESATSRPGLHVVA